MSIMKKFANWEIIRVMLIAAPVFAFASSAVTATGSGPNTDLFAAPDSLGVKENTAIQSQYRFNADSTEAVISLPLANDSTAYDYDDSTK